MPSIFSFGQRACLDHKVLLTDPAPTFLLSEPTMSCSPLHTSVETYSYLRFDTSHQVLKYLFLLLTSPPEDSKSQDLLKHLTDKNDQRAKPVIIGNAWDGGEGNQEATMVGIGE